MPRWLQRSLFGRRAVAVFAVAALLLGACTVQDSHARFDDEFHSAEHSQSVASTSNGQRSSSIIGKRIPLPDRAFLPHRCDQAPTPRAVVRPMVHREGPLPPARMRYRRTVHDDDDPPA